jgi:TPR repeat protein
MKSNNYAMFRQAMTLLDQGKAKEACRIAEELLQKSEEAYVLSGHLCLGLVYENGGEGVEVNLEKAISHYRHVNNIARDSLSYCYLARAYIKKGGKDYSAAERYLEEAMRISRIPEVYLGFALYYENGPSRDIKKAKKSYLCAAAMGRFQGFFGYSSVCRAEHQTIRALLADIARIVLGPIIAIFVGRGALDRF